MRGDYWQKFANLRLLLSYMICQPGKQLLFMGSEFGQWNEWYCKVQLDWNLLSFPIHDGLKTMVKDINHFYLQNGCLWERDFDHTGFEWIDFSDNKNCVISYLRKGSLNQVLCIHNFTPECHSNYFVKIPNLAWVKEAFNSDAEKYGGSGKHNHDVNIVRDHTGYPIGINISLAPLATMVFHIDFQK